MPQLQLPLQHKHALLGIILHPHLLRPWGIRKVVEAEAAAHRALMACGRAAEALNKVSMML